MKVSLIFLDSSAVEHSAVNRRVVGSNPTRGVENCKRLLTVLSFHRKFRRNCIDDIYPDTIRGVGQI